MKKLLPLLCLTLLLSACGGEKPTDAPVSLLAEDAAQAILDAGVFSEELEILDPSIAAALYGLEEESVLTCAAYLSTGATAEECTFLTVADEETAQTVLERFQTRVEDQTEALENYQPAEISKLENALCGCFDLTDGVMAYLIVAEDANGAQAALDGLMG